MFKDPCKGSLDIENFDMPHVSQIAYLESLEIEFIQEIEFNSLDWKQLIA